MKKYFEILLISENSKWEDVEKAFNELSEIYNADDNEEIDEFAEEFKKIEDAYKKLKKHFQVDNNYEENLDLTKKISKNKKAISEKNVLKNLRETNKNQKTSNKSKTNKKKTNLTNQKTNKKPQEFNINNFKNIEEVFDFYKKQNYEKKISLFNKIKELSKSKIEFKFLLSIILDFENVNNEESLIKKLNKKNIDSNKDSKTVKPKIKFKKVLSIAIPSVIILAFIVGIYTSYLNEKKADEAYIKSKNLLKEESFRLAEVYIDEAISYAPNNPSYYYLKAEILSKRGYYSSARISYQNAINRNFNSDSINFKIAKTYILQPTINEKNALLYFKKFIKKESKNYSDKLNSFSLDWNSPIIDKYLSIAYAEEIINNYLEGKVDFSIDDVREAKISTAKANLFLNNYDTTINQINSFISSLDRDNKAEAFNIRGIAYAELNNNNKAIEDYTAAINIRESPQYYENRGNRYYLKSEYTKAYLDYKKALDLGFKVDDLTSSYYDNSKKEYEKVRYTNTKRARYNKLKVGDFYEGGIIYKLGYNYKVKILATSTSSQKKTYYEAWRMCKDLSLNGFNDWKLPDSDDFTDIVDNRQLINYGLRRARVFTKEIKYDSYYWTTEYSDEEEKYYAYRSIKENDSYWRSPWNNTNYVRAVREHTFK